jgi:hypothetical protein
VNDRPRRSDTGDDSGMDYERESTRGIPRWVKVAGIVAAVLVLLVVAMMLIGSGGGHTPLRHGGGTGKTPPVGATGSHAPPAGVHG